MDKNKFDILKIYNELDDAFLKIELLDIIMKYLDGDKSMYDIFLNKIGYIYIKPKKIKKNYDHICELCNGELLFSNDKKFLICDSCGASHYDIVEKKEIKKIFIDEKRKIKNYIIKFNFDFLKSEERLNYGEKNKICNLYLLIKNNIRITGRKYNFKMVFLFSRLLTIIGRSDLKKYINFTLSKSTYDKYMIQWKKITEINNFDFENMEDIQINKYNTRKKNF